MTDDESRDFAPEDTHDGVELSKSKGRQAFRKITRELSDDDLSNSAVQRLLLDELERLETENKENQRFREKFSDADKAVAILQEKAKGLLAIEIIYGVCLTVGAMAVSYSQLLWGDSLHGPVVLAFGVILIVGGILAKVAVR